MTTTAKTNAELLAEAQAQRGAELLQEHAALRTRVEEILRLDSRRDGYIEHIYDLGDDSYVVELTGGTIAHEYGTTYRTIVRGHERESRIYLALDHAILGVVAARNVGGSDAYVASTFAARALGVDTGIE
jgi:hypothetical protein